MEELIARGHALQGNSQVLISATDAERIVERLREFTVEEVGTSSWMEQHDWIDKLNVQAHQNAQSHADEFVKEYLVSYNKLSVLIHELLVFEIWKQKVFPILRSHIAQHVDSVSAYLLMYHEAALTNLLEVTLYHQDACEAVEEDHLLELCDWCYRKMTYLNSGAVAYANRKEKTMAEMMSASREEELQEKHADVEFQTAMGALTIQRYLSDYVTVLSLGVLSRLTTSNDTIMALIPLLDCSPWVRRRKNQIEKFIEGAWRAVEPSDRLRITLQDAQVWLTLHNLIVEPKCRAKYDYNDRRREAVLRLKRHMNEVLFDQLPLLKDLARVIDEISIGAPGDAGQEKNRLILEQVPMVRLSLLQRGNWAEVAERQRLTVFVQGGEGLVNKERMLSMLKAFEFMCGQQPPEADSQTEQQRRALEPVRVEARRRVRGNVFETWEEYSCALNTTKEPELVEVKGEQGYIVRGRRYRLLPMEPGASRPLPHSCKVVVKHNSRVAVAELELPAPEVRDGGAALAANIWLTVGSLQADGFTLQLKLRKVERPSDRDRIAGVWYIYQPAGGALTILDDENGPQQ